MLLKDDSNLFCSNWLIPLKLVPLSLPALNLGFYYPSIAFKGSAATAKSLQLCPTLCDPVDSSPPGSPVPGILQARTLEWVAISFTNAWKWKVKVKSLSRVRLFQPPGLQPTRLLRPWDFPGRSTRVGCHCFTVWATSKSTLWILECKR